MAANDPNSPRQKMINLMYLVFIAMLALNVSSEVLDGFELVEESLLRSVHSSTNRNKLIFNELEKYHETNPVKTQKYFDQAALVKQKSDTLFKFVEGLKWKVVKQSDGEDGDPAHLKHPDDLNAAFEVLIAPGKKDGKKLKDDIDAYRQYVSSLIADSAKRKIIESNLSTQPSKKARENKQTWEESMFYQMPLAASVTILTKIQNDIRYAEGEVLNTILKNIDVGDYRVNKIDAHVVPKSQIVMRGTSYEAEIILAAVDTTLRPKVIVNGREIPNGRLVEGTSASGLRTVKGEIQIMQADGGVKSYPFSTEYMVVEPSATIAPIFMNVLYSNYKNPIRIAAPGIPSQNISASMDGKPMPREGDLWIATPTAKVGSEVVISVDAKMPDGRSMRMGEGKFRIRAFPPALPYLEYTDANGNLVKFRGGRISKATLINITGVRAAVDDDMIRVPYAVQKFETVFFDSMGNTVRETSDGTNFSQRQKDYIRGLSKGKSFFIRGIVASGPDGTKELGFPLEVIVN